MPNGIDPTRRATLMPYQSEPVVRPMFRSLGIAASGLSAQRQRMETIAQNLANIDVTRGPDGGPYKRRDVVVETATAANTLYPGPNPLELGGSSALVSGRGTAASSNSDGAQWVEVPVMQSSGVGPALNGEYGVRIAGIAEDQGEGKLVYEPGHPNADANGFVRMPNIDRTQELVNLMDAKRIYEANASVFQTAKAMLRASLDI
jgi:flagellar basal-body rod protein FlgC